MVTALVRVLENDALRSNMRSGSMERMKTHFSLDAMAASYRSVCLGR
jgi:glycosyltransferase involved in cell wall biosynthesis